MPEAKKPFLFYYSLRNSALTFNKNTETAKYAIDIFFLQRLETSCSQLKTAKAFQQDRQKFILQGIMHAEYFLTY